MLRPRDCRGRRRDRCGRGASTARVSSMRLFPWPRSAPLSMRTTLPVRTARGKRGRSAPGGAVSTAFAVRLVVVEQRAGDAIGPAKIRPCRGYSPPPTRGAPLLHIVLLEELSRLAPRSGRRWQAQRPATVPRRGLSSPYRSRPLTAIHCKGAQPFGRVPLLPGGGSWWFEGLPGPRGAARASTATRSAWSFEAAADETTGTTWRRWDEAGGDFGAASRSRDRCLVPRAARDKRSIACRRCPRAPGELAHAADIADSRASFRNSALQAEQQAVSGPPAQWRSSAGVRRDRSSANPARAEIPSASRRSNAPRGYSAAGPPSGKTGPGATSSR